MLIDSSIGTDTLHTSSQLRLKAHSFTIIASSMVCANNLQCATCSLVRCSRPCKRLETLQRGNPQI